MWERGCDSGYLYVTALFSQVDTNTLNLLSLHVCTLLYELWYNAPSHIASLTTYSRLSPYLVRMSTNWTAQPCRRIVNPKYMVNCKLTALAWCFIQTYDYESHQFVSWPTVKEYPHRGGQGGTGTPSLPLHVLSNKQKTRFIYYIIPTWESDLFSINLILFAFVSGKPKMKLKTCSWDNTPLTG